MSPHPSIEVASATLHGHHVTYRHAGEGPPLVLLHGITGNSAQWESVMPVLARSHTVIAPDLLGHGESAKPRGDYSLGAYASGVRDLLALLGHDRATVVGHSLGGGVAMQLAYQYPERCERLVLVASGGLGSEVTPLLRMAALPGAAAVIGASLRLPARLSILTAIKALALAGLVEEQDAEELTRIWKGLRDRSTRAAFLRTLRGVVDLRGQSISSHDRAYLTADIPTLLMWGGRDPVLPVGQVQDVAALLPGATVDVVPRAGHMPHRTDVQHFVAVVSDFIRRTEPARHDPVAWRSLLAAGDPGQVRSSSVQHLAPPPALSSSDKSTGTGT